MEISSTVYSNTNGLQTRDAQKLMDWILNECPREMDIIVDVGCGSGNVTKLLRDSISNKQILAFDTDPKMIDLAIKMYSKDDIEYVIQDASQPWDSLHPKIKALEGTVDLIFSNYVLHWITDKELAFQNLFRLLKPSGVLYFNIGTHHEISDFLSSEEKEEIQKYLKIDSPEMQKRNFSQTLEQVGFENVQIQLLNNEWEFQSPELCMEMMKLFRNCIFKFLIEDREEKYGKLKSKIEDLIFKSYSVKTGEEFPLQLSKDQCTVFYDSYRGRAQKPDLSVH